MPETIPDFDELARTLRLTIGRIARVLRRNHRTGELTLSEASFLARLDNEGPSTPGALAEAENVRPQAIAATLAHLESQGYVHRDPDPLDGRRAIVSLSTQGQALREERTTESVLRLAQAIETTFTAEELPELNQAVALLSRLADAL